jgi:hypothetical protein
MPVIVLWGIPTLIVLAGGTYLLIHHSDDDKGRPWGGLLHAGADDLRRRLHCCLRNRTLRAGVLPA